MKAKATIIFFEIQGRKKYVSEMSIRPDNTVVPIYDDDPDEAHQFPNEGEATKKIELFHNVHNRVFKTELIDVTFSNANPFSARSKGIIGSLVD